MSDFSPPSPGSWHLETVHASRPRSRAWAAIGCDESATAGFRESMRRYGLLLDTVEFAEINRFWYTRLRAVGAPKRPTAGPPPKMLFTIMTKVHPEIRRRNHTITQAFANKLWRQDVDRWDNEVKPALIRRNTELQHTDLAALDNEKLIEHLTSCFDAMRQAWRQHHSFNATCLLPLGDFLAHLQDWTPASIDSALPLFQGASPASLGAVAELQAVHDALAADPDAAALMEGGTAEDVLATLRAHPGPLGDAVREYLDVAGIRLATGYDIADLTLAEMPGVILGNFLSTRLPSSTRRAPEGNAGDDPVGLPRVAELEASLRAAVPTEHRAEFDELLTEARLTYRIRDERTYFNDTWSTGIARRAVLEAGRRLAADGRLHAAEDAVELTHDELFAALRGDGAPVADAAAQHTAFRLSHTTDDAPEWVGGPPGGDPPPADWLPRDAARGQRAMQILINSMFETKPDSADSGMIPGFAASPGKVTAAARLVRTPAEMARLQPGDILVTPFTSPAFNGVLPIISGIVTDRGGSLSHAAIVAREFGIPAVVGCGDAT
ncbi:MAG TPA: PEP-utilizing enzyme, partial [Nakamurella sp.]